MSEQDETRPQVEAPAELVLARQRTQLELWQARESLELEYRKAELEAAKSSGVLGRFAEARMLAGSDLVPAGFRVPASTRPQDYERALNKAASSILLAQELGTSYGYETAAMALQNLEVIEGRVSLKNESALARVVAAGHTVREEFETNGNGITYACTVYGTRDGAEGSPVRFTLLDAERMRLCTLEFDRVRESEDTITGVTSKKDNWAKHWPDMLYWRAVSRLLKRQFGDVVRGVPISVDLEPEDKPAAQPPPAVARQLTAVPDASQVLTDLETAGPEWWQHAGATVKRRNARQMAADRLAGVFKTDPESLPESAWPPSSALPDIAPERWQRDEAPAEQPPAEHIELGAEMDQRDQMVPEDVQGGVEPPGDPYAGVDPEDYAHGGSPLESADPQQAEPITEESERTGLLVLLDDYASRTGQSRDALTLRSRAVLSPPAGPVIGVEEMTTEQLAEMLDALGPMVETWSGPDS